MSSSKRKKTVSTANIPSIIKKTTTTTVVTYTCVDLDEHSMPAKSTKKSRTSVIKAPATLTSELLTQRRSCSNPSLALKAEFIAEVNVARENDPKASASSIGRNKKYNFDRFMAARTMSNSKAILDKVADMGPRNSTKMTKLYPRVMDVVEKVLFLQFKHEIDSDIPVNNSRLRDIAMDTYFQMLPYLDPSMAPKPIQFSDGWLTNFKRNYGIRMYVGHGEEGNVDMVKHGPRFEQTAEQLSQFKPADIYNCAETGLYSKVLSNKTLAVDIVGGKKVTRDARVSILLCCNADGSDKRMPFVLCKS